MSLKKSLGKILLFVVLEAGAMLGMPLGPRQIEELMQVMHRTHHEHVLKKEEDDGLE